MGEGVRDGDCRGFGEGVGDGVTIGGAVGAMDGAGVICGVGEAGAAGGPAKEKSSRWTVKLESVWMVALNRADRAADGESSTPVVSR